MSTNQEETINKLRAPFPADRIEWRIGSCGEKQDGSVWARCLAYIDNRAAMERLDEVFGMNWSHTEEFKQIGEHAVCTVTIVIEGRLNDLPWPHRSVCGSCAVEANGDIDPFKSAASGAMKRAVVNLGIGRFLYELPEAWAVIDPNGKYDGKTKQGTRFRWNPPQLPTLGGSGDQAPQPVRAAAPAHKPASKPVAFRNDFKKDVSPDTLADEVVEHATKVPVAAPAAGAGYGPAEASLVVPFGRNKGKTLGELAMDDLNYWANVWEPKPWEKTGKVGPKDMKLKAAAKQIHAARIGGAAKATPPDNLEVPAYEEPQDDVPF